MNLNILLALGCYSLCIKKNWLDKWKGSITTPRRVAFRGAFVHTSLFFLSFWNDKGINNKSTRRAKRKNKGKEKKNPENPYTLKDCPAKKQRKKERLWAYESSIHSFRLCKMLLMEKYWNSNKVEAQAEHLATIWLLTLWGLSPQFLKTLLLHSHHKLQTVVNMSSCHETEHLEEKLETFQAKESWATVDDIDHWFPNRSRIEFLTEDEKGQWMRRCSASLKAWRHKGQALTNTLSLLRLNEKLMALKGALDTQMVWIRN